MAERKGENQKLKMLYLVQLFSRETDDAHKLTMPEIISKLAADGVNADRKTLYQDFHLFLLFIKTTIQPVNILAN